MKQTRPVLVNYLTCQDPVMVNKWQNILDSFWHKDDGKLVTSFLLEEHQATISFIDGNGAASQLIIPIYKEPATFEISKINGLQNALNNKVDKIVGKGLSTQDFTTELKDKLEGLENYVHPESHSIAEVDGLQDILDQLGQNDIDLNQYIQNVQNMIPPDMGLRSWNDYLWYKSSANLGTNPIANEMLEGRGDGRFSDANEHGKWLVQNPDPQTIDDVTTIYTIP